MLYWPKQAHQFSLLKTLYRNDTTTASNSIREAIDTLSDLHNRIGNLRAKYTESEMNTLNSASVTIRHNFIRLNIYLQEASATEHLQMPAYRLVDLFADIGGTFLLWMGVSVLTIVELFELIMALLLIPFGSETFIIGEKIDDKLTDDQDEEQNTSENMR